MFTLLQTHTRVCVCVCVHTYTCTYKMKRILKCTGVLWVVRILVIIILHIFLEFFRFYITDTNFNHSPKAS